MSQPDDHSTPLDYEEKLGLIPSWVSFRHELNELEQANIASGTLWALRQIRKTNMEILDDRFIKDVHRRMLGDVWRWAGKFRTTEKNIGVQPYQIVPSLRNLLDDTKYWIEFESYEKDELLARFHHRLVFIHPFPNGNGRHARLMTDLLAHRLGTAALTWGARDMTSTGEVRTRYINGLHMADHGQFQALIEFIRS